MLFGPTVLIFFLCSLLFGLFYIGLRVILISGKFGISYFELLLMFEIFAGHRLHAEKAIRPHLRPRRPLVFRVFQLVLGKRSGMGVSFSIAFSGLWVIFQEVLLGSFLVNLVPTTLDCCMWVRSSVDMVSPLALVRVVTFSFSLLF